jgi:hypothetical protein
MFDYLGVLLSVIFGLALTNVLFGLSTLIQLRRTARPYWVQIVWAAATIIYVLAVWWGMFWWRQLASWRFEGFLFLVGYAIVIFMWAAMLFPPSPSEDTDYKAYYFSNRRWFFGLMALAQALDIPETLAKQTNGLRDVPIEYRLFLPFVMILSLIGWVTPNRRAHGIIAIAFLGAQIAYLTLSALDRINTGQVLASNVRFPPIADIRSSLDILAWPKPR